MSLATPNYLKNVVKLSLKCRETFGSFYLLVRKDEVVSIKTKDNSQVLRLKMEGENDLQRLVRVQRFLVRALHEP